MDVPSSNCCDNPSPNFKTLCLQNRLPNSELQLVQNCLMQWEIDMTRMAVGNLIDSPTGSPEMLSFCSTLPVAVFTAKGLSAAYVSVDTDDETRDRIYEGEFQLLFIGPEQLLGKKKCRLMLRSDLYKSNLVGFVVDEGHLVKQW